MGVVCERWFIVMSFRGSIGYAGICMRVLVYDLIVIACIVF